MMGVNGGTTDAITIAVIEDNGICSCEKSPVTINPTSSAVRSRSVSSRQLTRRSLPSNTPTTMLVLPTSIANSKVPGSSFQVQGSGSNFSVLSSDSVPRKFSSDDSLDTIGDSHQQGAVVIDAGGHARLHAGGRRPRHARAPMSRRARAPGVENSIEPAGEQVGIPRAERNKRLDKHLSAIDWPSELALN